MALDASADEPRTERALAVALARAPERLFLFRCAALAGARVALSDLDRQDERFLDLAASWLLEGAPGEPPRRSSLPVPLLEIGIAVADDDRAPLTTTQRALEMIGDKICMAVPDASKISPEEIDNASLWIAGGAVLPRVDDHRGRATIVPGDVLADGGTMTVVDASASELKITRVDIEGREVEARATSFAGLVSRMQVQGRSSR